jgi:hypothetical protein
MLRNHPPLILEKKFIQARRMSHNIHFIPNCRCQKIPIPNWKQDPKSSHERRSCHPEKREVLFTLPRKIQVFDLAFME